MSDFTDLKERPENSVPPRAADGLKAAGKTALATGAAARLDASRTGVTNRYVVASKHHLGHRRGGHTFGPTAAVYTLSPELAKVLLEQGQVRIAPFKAGHDDAVEVVDDDEAPARELVTPALTPVTDPFAANPPRAPGDRGR